VGRKRGAPLLQERSSWAAREELPSYKRGVRGPQERSSSLAREEFVGEEFVREELCICAYVREKLRESVQDRKREYTCICTLSEATGAAERVYKIERESNQKEREQPLTQAFQRCR